MDTKTDPIMFGLFFLMVRVVRGRNKSILEHRGCRGNLKLIILGSERVKPL